MKSISKTLQFSNKINVNFLGGHLTSDSGALLYHEFDQVIGFSKTIKHTLDKEIFNIKATHQLSDKMIQKIYQHICGYHTDDCADDLKNDPLFNLLFDHRIASQPTLSRVNKDINEKNVHILSTTNLNLLDAKYPIQQPRTIILDCDSTGVQAFGDQELTNYNAHYQQNGYHPLVLFDGVTGDFIKAELRKGSDYTSTGIGDFIKPVISFYQKYELDQLLFRADSGFATPELYTICEENDNQVTYVIRLKENNKLHEAVKDIEAEFYDSNKLVQYYEFEYQANSWDKSRRVICKLEKKIDELLVSKTFIVTNDSEMSPKGIFAFYSQRGTMENYIKESKLGFNFTNLSSHKFYTNCYHMYVKLIAYNLNNFFRTMVLPLKEQSYQMETIRSKIIKIAGKVVKSGRQITIKLSQSYPFKKLFEYIYYQIINLKIKISLRLNRA